MTQKRRRTMSDLLRLKWTPTYARQELLKVLEEMTDELEALRAGRLPDDVTAGWAHARKAQLRTWIKHAQKQLDAGFPLFDGGDQELRALPPT